MWFRRKVQKGDQLGRKIGYPTLNFHVGHFGKHHSAGVYACDVHITGKKYRGALYYGPRLHYKTKCLEIYLLNFDRKIYGTYVQFRVLRKIRAAKRFSDLNDLKTQIQSDINHL